MDELVTTRQLQDLLKVDRITIYRMLNDGRLQGFKVAGQWRFSRQAVERWLQGQQSAAQPRSSPRRAQAVSLPGSDLPPSCTQPIQDILAAALGIGAVVTAMDGQPLTVPSNANAFCALLLGSPARRLCVDWWRKTARELGAGVQVLTCHAGLRCTCERIDVQGQAAAILYAGQLLDPRCAPGSEGWVNRIAGLAEAVENPSSEARAALREALGAVPDLDEDDQVRLLHLVPQAAAALAKIGEERASLIGRLRRIAEITGV